MNGLIETSTNFFFKETLDSEERVIFDGKCLMRRQKKRSLCGNIRSGDSVDVFMATSYLGRKVAVL